MIGLIFILISFIGITYYLFTSDSEHIPALLCQIIKEELGVEMTFSHFNVDRTKNFPYLTILVDGVNIKGSHYDIYGKDLLRVNQLSLVLPPWELINQKYSFHNVAVDSATVFVLKDSVARSNTEFLKKLIKPKETNKNQAKEKVRLEQMRFNHVF